VLVLHNSIQYMNIRPSLAKNKPSVGRNLGTEAPHMTATLPTAHAAGSVASTAASNFE